MSTNNQRTGLCSLLLFLLEMKTSRNLRVLGTLNFPIWSLRFSDDAPTALPPALKVSDWLILSELSISEYQVPSSSMKQVTVALGGLFVLGEPTGLFLVT